jgi:hypothetical protein
MGFGWPLGLAALAVLLVPVLLHLARRKPDRPIRVGSLRHLPPGAAPRRARSRIVEPWLLAARMLLLTLLALLIAQPFLRSVSPARAPKSVLVLPADLSDDSLRLLLPRGDSLLASGAEHRRLPMHDLWSELAELDAGLPAGSSIAVVAPAELPMAGGRPALRSMVTLHRIDAPARRVGAPASADRAIRVHIAADSSFRTAAARLVAGLRAVAEMRGDSLALIENLGVPADVDWIIRLSDSTPGPRELAAVRAGATLLTNAARAPRTGHGAVTLEPFERGRIISAPVLAVPPLDGTFPELLARIWPDPGALAPRKPESRRMSTGQLQPARAAPARTGDARMRLDTLLLALAFGLFLLERWMAHRPATMARG